MLNERPAMVFNSYTFVLFFAGVLVLHHLPISWKFKKLNLLWASYLFYAAWNPPFVILLWISTAVDWFAAKGIDRSDRQAPRRAWLLLSLGTNLGLLGFFKYGDFLLENFVTVCQALGIEFAPARLRVVLPVGISFYTFQTLSYTLDVYRGKLRPWPSLLDYALYVTFFPQLVAGPIVRAADYLPQCVEPRPFSCRHLSWGLVLLVVGLFEKVVVADGLLAPVVERVYDSGVAVDSLTAWSGTLAFAGQIFCDFAGYSSCAVGAAMCLGFRVPDNFLSPYAAVGFSDFWSRWHISLSTWLRDYLYIPLGGNRKGTARTYVNLMLTMLLGGLWHGASWTFVCWGALHGIFLSVERMCRRRFGALSSQRGAWQRLTLTLLTFALVCFTWVFFRAESFESAFALSGSMLGLSAGAAQSVLDPRHIAVSFGTVFAILCVQAVLRDRSLEDFATRCPWWLVSLAVAAMAYLTLTMSGEERAFIYFQF